MPFVFSILGLLQSGTSSLKVTSWALLQLSKPYGSVNNPGALFVTRAL